MWVLSHKFTTLISEIQIFFSEYYPFFQVLYLCFFPFYLKWPWTLKNVRHLLLLHLHEYKCILDCTFNTCIFPLLCNCSVSQPPGAEAQCIAGNKGVCPERLQRRNRVPLPDQVPLRARQQGEHDTQSHTHTVYCTCWQNPNFPETTQKEWWDNIECGKFKRVSSVYN